MPPCSRAERILDVELPLADIQKIFESDQGIRHDQLSYPETEEIPITKEDDRLGHTFSGEILTIEYFIAVFVKPDAWSSFGEGAVAKFPITIKDPPITKIKATKIALPEGWNPVIADTSKLTLDTTVLDDSYLV